MKKLISTLFCAVLLLAQLPGGKDCVRSETSEVINNCIVTTTTICCNGPASCVVVKTYNCFD